jgi:plasmid replication initiation protein
MNHKNLTVCKANEVIEAGYKLSLNEQRVVLACIGQVNSMEELLKTDEFELSAKDFAKVYGISEDRAYSELQEVAKNLYQRSLTIYNPDPKRPKLKKIETRWISSIGYMPEDGKITLCFAQKLLPYLSGLKGSFTRYDLVHVGNMTCTYAIRLYELLMQWKTTGTRTIEIDWLKKQFQLDASYDRMDNFKARVLDPAVKDINTHSNYQVSWEQRKTGRRVTHLTFSFAEKQPLTPEKPKRVAKPKEKMILGVAVSEIEKLARIGESYEQAAARINKEKEAAKKPAATKTPVQKTDPIQPKEPKKPVTQHIQELKNALKNKTAAE